MKIVVIVLKLMLLLIIMIGIIYPALMTYVAQLFFKENAGGSLIRYKDKIVGSRLIGQQFDSAIWFNSRPSSISYNPLPSGGSNLGPTSKKLSDLIKERYNSFIHKNGLSNSTEIPPEMLSASASGLDPHISPQAALMQLDRIAIARGFDERQKQELRNLIKVMTEPPQFHFFGKARINVFMLNLALDKIQ